MFFDEQKSNEDKGDQEQDKLEKEYSNEDNPREFVY